MLRRSPPAAARFPVGVRVATPDAGFGPQFDVMQGWLEAQLGADAVWLENGPGENAVLFRFLDLGAAKAFIDRFACGVIRAKPSSEGWSR